MHISYGLGHANSRISKSKCFVGFVWDNIDTQVFARVQLAWVGKRFISNLVKSIRGVGNEFPQENFFIAVNLLWCE